MQFDNNSILNIHVIKNTILIFNRKMNLKNDRCKTCLLSEFKTVGLLSYRKVY